jgi:hypothetical protein
VSLKRAKMGNIQFSGRIRSKENKNNKRIKKMTSTAKRCSRWTPAARADLVGGHELVPALDVLGVRRPPSPHARYDSTFAASGKIFSSRSVA